MATRWWRWQQQQQRADDNKNNNNNGNNYGNNRDTHAFIHLFMHTAHFPARSPHFPATSQSTFYLFLFSCFPCFSFSLFFFFFAFFFFCAALISTLFFRLCGNYFVFCSCCCFLPALMFVFAAPWPIYNNNNINNNNNFTPLLPTVNIWIFKHMHIKCISCFLPCFFIALHSSSPSHSPFFLLPLSALALWHTINANTVQINTRITYLFSNCPLCVALQPPGADYGST